MKVSLETLNLKKAIDMHFDAENAKYSETWLQIESRGKMEQGEAGFIVWGVFSLGEGRWTTYIHV